jgi:hypothetical protein
VNRRFTFLMLAVIALSVLLAGPVHAREAESAQAPVQEPVRELPPPQEVDTQLQQARQQLQEIQKSLQTRRSQVEQLRRQLAQETDEVERRELEQRLEREESDHANLRRSFENIALGGVDMSVFVDPATPEEEFNWQQELQLILKPLVQELKELTEKPRQMERMRSQLALLENQRRIAQRALNNLERLKDDNLDDATRQRLDNLHQSWVQRLADIEREREIVQLQLNVLQDEGDTVLQQIRNSINEFFTGRGLNLALAIAAFFLTLFLMKGLYLLYHRLTWLSGMRAVSTTTGRRILEYGYQALTIFLAVLILLFTLYVLGDVLLLVLALILLLIVLLGLRNYLPRFLEETKLLLNVGAVRERERVVYHGLPWMVRSLGVYSRLYNPSLEGLLRLPLSEMLQLVSRPYREDEPWFPTQTGDWVMMEDGTVGEVLRQTPEIVQLKTRGTTRTYTTTSFLDGEPRNLSQGFGVAVTFGIDYQHQPISTTEIPKVLLASVEQGLQQSDFADHVEKVVVEFQSAGASSLDYLIYVIMTGDAADSYYPLTRLIQRICVDTCNERGWVIPFNQLTVHAGSPFEIKSS